MLSYSPLSSVDNTLPYRLLIVSVKLMAQHILKQREKKLEEEDERNASHYLIQS